MYWLIIQSIMAISCQQQGLGIENRTFLINTTDPFRYGFWTKYLSMSQKLDVNQLQFPYIQGYAIMRAINPNNITHILLYQEKTQQKTLKLMSFENNVARSLLDLNILIEGEWIYFSIAFTINTLQFISYSINNFQMKNFTVFQENHQQIQINLGENYSVSVYINQFFYGTSEIILANFLGLQSYLDYQQPALFFTYKNQFIDYLNTLNQPQSICGMQMFKTERITNLQYDSGLIVMESWVKLDYYSSLSVSTSVFGIEFIIQLQNYTLYQPLISLHYVVYQSYKLEMQNGISFGFLEYQNKDFQIPQRNVSSFQADTHIVSQNLRQWHYVQIYYGFLNAQPVQYMKIWFSDGTEFNYTYNKNIYPFQDRNLIVRAGQLSDISQSGVSVQNELSKIYICQPKFIEFTKNCHHSCLQCDGPNSSDCLLCHQDRYLDNRQCKCIFGYIESNDGVCKKFENLYPNAQQFFFEYIQHFSDIGYFAVGDVLFRCPQYHQHSKDILCIECLISPETFADNLICKTDFILNFYGQYEKQIRDSRNIELYILDEKENYLKLCVGCSQICLSNENDSNCFFSIQYRKYIKCQEGYYQNEGKCSLCSTQCKGCQAVDKCTSCNGNQILNSIICVKCPINCETCQFDQSLICLTCSERFSIYQGKCMPCGRNCQTCQYMLDKDNKYYNRCLTCLDSSKYYLELNAINCGLNIIDHCKYVIQFHGNFFVRQQDNTALHLFEKKDFNSSEVYTYCALCDGLGTFSQLKGQCYIDPQGYLVDSEGKICISAYQFDDTYNTQASWLNSNCIIGNQTNSSRPYSLIYGCQYLIQNCNACNYDHCVQCFPGYYPGISDGQCHKCPDTCLRCQQQSKIHKNGWKLWLIYITYYLFPQQFYSAVFGNEYGDQLEVVCTACNPGYELYKEQCILECPVNCEICIKQQDQNYCVKCHTYDGKVLSLYEGTCIECPRYCQLCYKKTAEQIQSANPYFPLDNKFVSTTHTCLLLEVGLNANEYTYDSNIKQYIKYSKQHIDPNTVFMKFNLYCDQFDIESNTESFLSQNVNIDEILSTSRNQTNFNRIENDNLFAYFGTQQIQKIDLEFTFLQDCSVNQISYLYTTLTKYVYFINQATLTLNGNNKRLILYETLDISGFDLIVFKNINIEIAQGNKNITLQSSKNLQVQFDQVTFTSTFQFSFNLINIRSISIQQFSLINTNILESFFKLINQKNNLEINVLNFTINECRFVKSNLFLLGNEISKIVIILKNITLFNSIFTESSVIETQQDYQLTMSDLIIQQSNITQCTPLFKINLAETFTLGKGLVAFSIFKDSSLFQLNIKSQIQDMEFTGCFLLNSTFFSQNTIGKLTLNLDQFTIFNLTYDSQYSILYASSSFQNSEIILSNWNLSSMHFNENIDFNSHQFLIYLEADKISLTYLTLMREQGFSEFFLGSATQITITKMQIDQGNFQPSILTNNECDADLAYSQYTIVFFIEKSQNIKFQDVKISNLIIFDTPMIQIVSIETQQKKREEYIIFINLVFEGCVVQKTKTESQIGIIYITSQQQILISLLGCDFFNNFYYVYQTESESDSALALYFIIENGDLLIDYSTFEGNYVSQSQNSLMSVFASSVIIQNTNLQQNNHFNENLLKHIDWGYRQQVTLQFLSNYFPVQCLSGNGYFSVDKLQIQNVTIMGSNAQQAGCFFVTLKNDAKVLIHESNFQEIKSMTKGGCFYLEDKALSINITLKSSIFKNIFALSEGGGIYYLPISQSITFNLLNISIIDTYSISGAFINLQFQNSLTQLLEVADCNILYTKEGLSNFLSINVDLFTTSVFVIQEGKVFLQNIVAQLYIIGLMQSIYTTEISLTQVLIEDSYYNSKQGIVITCSVGNIQLILDDNCKISFDGLIVKNLQFYNEIMFNKLLEKQSELYTQCKNEINILNPQDLFTVQKIIGEDVIPQYILIEKIKYNHQITFRRSYLSHNTCAGCQNGLIQLNFESDSSIQDFEFENLELIDNNCGNNGCLTFLLDSGQEKNIIINKLICSNNIALNGVCIFSQNLGLQISNSFLTGNQAKNFGGGLYFKGDVKSLLIYDNLISNNMALSGSSIYIENNSSPDLNKTNNYIESSSQSILSLPTSLSLTINNYQEILNNEIKLTLPSGQEISKYQYFNISSQSYQNLNLTFRIVPLNDYLERVKNLSSTFCSISSGYYSHNELILTNNYTNYQSKEFNDKTQDYNFDDLIIYFGANQGYLILQFQCNSIKIPIYDTKFPFQITNYISNYTLQMQIQTFVCQLGEYKDPKDDSCHLCDIDKKQYSVKYGAIQCQYMNDDTTLQITPAQLKLKMGYWRPYINNEIVEKCVNKFENCMGGWLQGDRTCQTGQIGARCESCDSYNTLGGGYYSSKHLYTCGECEEFGKQLLFILGTSAWMLISINLTTKGIESMLMEISKNRVGNIQVIINNNKQTGPYMKMFTNYLQNIALILNFNANIPYALKSYFTIFGNPQQQFLISTDCFMAQQFSLNIMYVKIIQCLTNPFIFGSFYLFIYFILIHLSKAVFNKIIIMTTILYLFFYFQPQAMLLLIQTLSFQTISGIDWIQANLAYKFYTSEHQSWIPYFIVLVILLGGLIPALLIIKLFLQRKKLFKHQFRNIWGFLVLEYQNKAYYWEFMRIITRELMIISITFFQDKLIEKCMFVFFIIFIYQLATALIYPFKTIKLNKLDVRSSIICLITILTIIADNQAPNIYNLVLIIIILPNSFLFISYITTIFSSYLQAYEETIDKVKNAVRRKFSNQIQKSKTLADLMKSKGERRKIIMARFQMIKQYLLSKSRISKFVDYNDKSIAHIRGRQNTGTNRFNYEGPLTQNYTRGESKTVFLNKI